MIPRLRFVLLIACTVSTIVLYSLLPRNIFRRHKDFKLIPYKPPKPKEVNNAIWNPLEKPKPKECAQLPGAEDVFLSLKTGASELREKLPVHYETLLQCIPHYAVFSDLEEQLNGHAIHDALEDVTSSIRFAHSDFSLYREMLEAQKDGTLDFTGFHKKPTGTDTSYAQEAEELAAVDAGLGLDKGFKTDNRAWALDKWKFLPILKKALEIRPTAKWFVFIEADTGLLFSNLLAWLSLFDPSEPLYFGGQSYFGDLEFAHGGAGFVLSAPALRKVVQDLNTNNPHWDEETDGICCGDMVVGKIVANNGIQMLRAWPVLQGERIDTLDYSDYHWCHPVVSFHHMGSDDIQTIWNFEQTWISNLSSDSTLESKAGPSFSSLAPFQDHPIRHADIFEHFVLPHLTMDTPDSADIDIDHPPSLNSKDHIQDWDNMSGDKVLSASAEHPEGDEAHAFASAAACRAYCASRSECVQWSFSAKPMEKHSGGVRGGGDAGSPSQGRPENDNTCKLGYVVRLGYGARKGHKHDPVKGVQSGWMGDRIRKFMDENKGCPPRWVTKNED